MGFVLMSFIGDLFGHHDAPAPAPMAVPAPQPLAAPAPVPIAPPATPTINDASSLTAGLEASQRLKSRYGSDSTILTNGLGDSSYSPSDINRTTALGGSSSLTPSY